MIKEDKDSLSTFGFIVGAVMLLVVFVYLWPEIMACITLGAIVLAVAIFVMWSVGYKVMQCLK